MRMDLVHSRKKWRFYVDELGPRKYLSSSCSPSQALPCHQLRRLHAGMAPVIRQPLCATPRVQQSAVSNSVVCGSPGLSPHFQPLRHARSPETPPPLPWAAWRQMTDALLQVLKWWNPMSFFWFGHAYSIHFNPIRISQVHGGPQFIIDPRDWGFAEPCCFACSSSSWESEPLSSDQDPRIPRCHTMSGCLDHRINFSRWFQDISRYFKPFKHPFNKNYNSLQLWYTR